jgi:riboflavin kinase/FMN adenylyltransferase
MRGLAEVAKGSRPTAVSIGNFDGVHRGHLAIIRRLGDHAASTGSAPTVVTFEPHPQKVLRGVAPPRLVTPERKLRLLDEAGVEQVVVVRFDKKFSLIEPEEFIERVLVKELSVRAVVSGPNWRFGHYARGDATMLRAFGRRLGFEFEAVRLSRLEGRQLSSTEVRHAIAEGDVRWARKALGRPHALPGRVVRGKGRGATLLGFPTANLDVAADMCFPKLGIYAGYFVTGHERRPAAISVGTNPTFGARNPVTVEAFVLDFKGNLLGRHAELELIERLRDEKKFPSQAALRAAMAEDVRATRDILDQSPPHSSR